MTANIDDPDPGTSTVKPKAYSYLRFSTPEQMKGDSFRRQTRLAQEYANKHGLDLDEHSFEDLGMSAYRGRNQEAGALSLFLRAVEGEIIERGSYLLVESLDRISRQSARKASSVLGDICDLGITVVTLFDGKAYDAETLDKDPVAFVMAVLIFMRANEESATKAKRLRAAWEGKRKRLADGESVRLTSVAPRWLRPDENGCGFELIPERAQVVARIFSLSLEGMGAASITETLNKEQIPTFGKSRYWHKSYVNKILQNPAVYGTLTPFTSSPEKKANRSALDPVEDYFPAVIDQETFSRAQAVRVSRSPRRGRHASTTLQNLLGGLAACPLCDDVMTRVTKNKAKGWIYFVCQSAKNGSGCEYNAVRYDAVESIILERIEELCASCPTGDTSLDDQLQEVSNNLEGVEGSIHNILESIENGLLPSRYASIGDRLRDLEDERDRLKEKLEALHQQEATFSNNMAQKRAQRLEATVREDSANLTAINSVMRECFSKVVIDFTTGDLDFHWRHGGLTNLIYMMPVA